ncbi:MAG TPA: YicC/YloC family endoribonuclease [Candidatus Polarisedimenticolia bacterium]|nr:YicC/YloC family endoribonuclease [Candidatus Polarisedimenticolia bacterium]
MTGFGQGTAERNGVAARVELKGVNHRFLDIKMRLPGEVGLLEPRLRALIQARVTRARIDIVTAIVSSLPSPARVVVNESLVAEYLKGAASLKKEFALRGSVGLETVLGLPGVVSIQAGAAPDDGVVEAVLTEAMRAALDAYDTMRASEGRRLVEDLNDRLRTIREAASRIEAEARGLPESYARRIKERLAVLLDGGRVVEEGRLAQEVALLAGRADITEELVRLQGYLKQMEETLARPGGPIGKTLDFIMQEMNREANTISSKAEALPICQQALVIKAEVEKIREQAQNLE